MKKLRHRECEKNSLSSCANKWWRWDLSHSQWSLYPVIWQCYANIVANEELITRVVSYATHVCLFPMYACMFPMQGWWILYSHWWEKSTTLCTDVKWCWRYIIKWKSRVQFSLQFNGLKKYICFCMSQTIYDKCNDYILRCKWLGF